MFRVQPQIRMVISGEWLKKVEADLQTQSAVSYLRQSLIENRRNSTILKRMRAYLWKGIDSFMLKINFRKPCEGQTKTVVKDQKYQG